MNNVRSEAGLARQGKLKRLDGSEVNAMAVKTSVKASFPKTSAKASLPRTLRSRSDLGRLHFRDSNNQRHVLLER